jgi:hypothetical protein
MMKIVDSFTGWTLVDESALHHEDELVEKVENL